MSPAVGQNSPHNRQYANIKMWRLLRKLLL